MLCKTKKKLNIARVFPFTGKGYHRSGAQRLNAFIKTTEIKMDHRAL